MYGENITENECNSIFAIYKNTPTIQVGVIEYIISGIWVYNNKSDSQDIIKMEGTITEKDYADKSTGKDWSEYILITNNNEEIRLGDPRFINNNCIESAFKNQSRVTLKLRVSKDAAAEILSYIIN